jgi:hypothetical protein
VKCLERTFGHYEITSLEIDKPQLKKTKPIRWSFIGFTEAMGRANVI